MTFPQPQFLKWVLLGLLALLATSCVPANAQTAPAWLTRLDPEEVYGYRGATWSPDSERIAYARNEVVLTHPPYDDYRSSEIFVMDVDTRETRQLTHNDLSDDMPTWSPDGKQIAYLHTDNTLWLEKDIVTGSLRIVNADGTDDKEIFACVHGCAWLTWSPANNQIAVGMESRKDAPEKMASNEASIEIFLINPDGSNLTQVTQGNKPIQQPKWSPDGRQIVFIRSHLKSIQVLNVQNQTETSFEVGDLTGISGPNWSPDQSGIIFSASPPEQGAAQLYFLHLADGKISPVFEQAMSEFSTYEPEWSPDGTKLLFNNFWRGLYLAKASAMRQVK